MKIRVASDRGGLKGPPAVFNSSVSILKWMDLGESMMKPGRFHLRRHIFVAGVPRYHLVHFGRDMFGPVRRAVQVHRAIGTHWVV